MYTIKEDWNITAQAYDAFNCAPDSYSYSIEWPAIQKMLPVLKGRKVLDIGCGSGIFTFLLEEYEPEEIAGLLKQIGTESGYERIVVDMGHMGKGALELFAACDVVYMPVLDDPVSTAKLEDFETYLKEAGHKGMEEKIQKLHLPEIKTGIRRGGYMEQLLWSEMGDYVRKLLEGGY